MTPRYRNRILSRLPSPEQAAVARHLVPVTLPAGGIIYETGAKIDRVYFPEDSIILLLVELADGRGVDGAAVGVDGIVGVGGILSNQRSFTTQRVQRGGASYCMKQTDFTRLLGQCDGLQATIAAYRDAFTAHLLQSTACNAAHTAEERLARWILELLDLSPSSRIAVTHDSLAGMVGCNRPTVTLCVRSLESRSLIATRRGAIEVIDRRGLEAHACSCYRFIRGAFDGIDFPSAGGRRVRPS